LVNVLIFFNLCRYLRATLRILTLHVTRPNYYTCNVFDTSNLSVSIYQPTQAPFDTPFMTYIYQLLYVSASRCHRHGVIITNVYKPICRSRSFL